MKQIIVLMFLSSNLVAVLTVVHIIQEIEAHERTVYFKKLDSIAGLPIPAACTNPSGFVFSGTKLPNRVLAVDLIAQT